MSDMDKPNQKEHVHPKKDDKGLRKDVRLPFERVSFTTFMNLLGAGLLVVLAVYTYSAARTAVGIAQDATPSILHPFLWPFSAASSASSSNTPQSSSSSVPSADPGMTSGVEGHIAALAAELGMGKDSDLAVAIADAVRLHVPPASLSAIEAQAQETGGSRVVDALLGKEPAATGAAKVAETLGKVVGTDDAPEALA